MCTGTDNLGGILNFFVSQIYLTSFGVLVNHDLDYSFNTLNYPLKQNF
jgi:hypothetical protein